MNTFLRAGATTLVAAGLLLSPACGATSPVEKARMIVSDISDGKYEEVRELFDEGLRGALSLKQLEQDWEGFVKLKGDYRSQKDADVTERGDVTVVDIEVAMEDDLGVVRVSLGPDGKISRLFFLASDIPVP